MDSISQFIRPMQHVSSVVLEDNAEKIGDKLRKAAEAGNLQEIQFILDGQLIHIDSKDTV